MNVKRTFEIVVNGEVMGVTVELDGTVRANNKVYGSVKRESCSKSSRSSRWKGTLPNGRILRGRSSNEVAAALIYATERN